MFSGIIESQGTVARREGAELLVLAPLHLSVGDSIAVVGVCLTVRSLGEGRFSADLSEETLSRTTFDDLEPGSSVNLERAVSANGRLGGHIVSGHVDGVGPIVKRSELADSVEVWFSIPGGLERYLIEKGSVAVDGVSLTVARISGAEFMVSLIPQTLEATGLGSKTVSDRVNIEVDQLAKYVERLLEVRDGVRNG